MARPPPPAASSGAALDHAASGLIADGARDELVQQLHPLESSHEASTSQNMLSAASSDTESDGGSISVSSRGALLLSPSSASDLGKLQRSYSTASSGSFSQVRTPRAELRWVEHRLAACNTDINLLSHRLGQLSPQNKTSKHAAESDRAVNLARSRSEQAISKQRAQLEALEEETARVLRGKVRSTDAAKAARQRLQAACKVRLSTEALVEATQRQIPQIISAHAAAVLAEHEAASTEGLVSECHAELVNIVDSAKSRVSLLIEERHRLEVQDSELVQRAQAMVQAREQDRQGLIEEGKCLRAEIQDEWQQFGEALLRMEGMMDHLESSAGPEARIAEAATLHFEERSLREEWEKEAASAEENFEEVVRRGRSSMAGFQKRLKEQQLISKRRSQDVMESGVNAITVAKAEGTESLKRSEALSARIQQEGRRLRADLVKTSKFLNGHQERNVRLEEVAAASQREFDLLSMASAELQQDVAATRERRELLASELQVEQKCNAGLQLEYEESASRDWTELAELRAEAKELTGNLLEERETLSRMTDRWQAVQNYWHVLAHTREQVELSTSRFALEESALEQHFEAELSERELQMLCKREELVEAFAQNKSVSESEADGSRSYLDQRQLTAFP